MLLSAAVSIALYGSTGQIISRGGAMWAGHAGNSAHTGISLTPSRPLDGIAWSTPVDLNPRYSGNDLLTHYGAPCITSANIVITAVKQNLDDGFKVRAFSGTNGAAFWTENTDYSVPTQSWIPSVSPTLVNTRGNTFDPMVAYPMGGGRVAFRLANSKVATPVVQAFYGNTIFSNSPTNYLNNVKICTPLTSGPDGSVYFGFAVTGPTSLSLTSGLAKVNRNGTATWIPASTLSGESSVDQIKQNCAPAIDASGKSLYITTYTGNFGRGYLVKLNPNTLQPVSRVRLVDPRNGNDSSIDALGTASPVIGLDGDVYMGVLENPFGSNHLRGILLHYSGDLSLTKIPGAFGWDDTPTVIPSFIVGGYTGPSSYLLLCKYNNYVFGGGDGANRIAIVDPNVLELDAIAGIPTMKVVKSILCPTADTGNLGVSPVAVREWCVNTAAVDIAKRSVVISAEDGVLYRWNLVNNTLSEHVQLTPGIGEAYTPTAIGPDGRVYAIANARLYAVGIKR